MKKNLPILVIFTGFLALCFTTKRPDLVSTEKIRVTQASDLASIPATTADMLIVVDRATDITNGTMPMPATPIDYQTFTISSAVDITNMTLNSNGKTVSGSVSTLMAGDCVAWTFDVASDKWFRTTNPMGVDIDQLAYQMLGSPIIAETAGQTLAYANTASNLVDNQVRYMEISVPRTKVLTGLKFYVRTLGSYTGDNNNRVGLYSYSGGVLTLVASSANSASLWTSAANAIQTIPFSATYTAAPGVYYAALLYNQSAQTTAPGLASGVALNNAAMSGTAFGFANSAKLFGTSTGNDLPSTINMSAVTASAIPTWTAIY